jgi:hypothetical protein
MAYYIFLKSLRSLEEFGKNPHIESLHIFKNSIFIPKKNFLQILAQSAMPPAGLFSLSAYAAQAPPPPPLTLPCHAAPNGHPQ